jgi:hypothetical protein
MLGRRLEEGLISISDTSYPDFNFIYTLTNRIYRYQQVILKPILIPFALEYKRTRPGTIMQEDNAPAYSSKY